MYWARARWYQRPLPSEATCSHEFKTDHGVSRGVSSSAVPSLHCDTPGRFSRQPSLSLLPLSTRRELLWKLPVADICLRLENTDFIAGLDMEAFWKSTWKDAYAEVAESSRDGDIKGYFRAWEKTEYAKQVLYGLLATVAIGQLHDVAYTFYSPLFGRNITGYQEDLGMPVFSFLYAIRKPKPTQYKHHRFITCDLVFPLRYSDKFYKSNNDLTINEVVHCFSSSGVEFPKIFPVVGTSEEMNPEYVYFLRNAIYLGIDDAPFELNAVKFIQAVIEEATNLEVLILDHWGDKGEREVKIFDEFCAFLSTCKAFLSNFRFLKIFSSLHSNDFVVSRKNFNKLITAYFATPTDHVQKLQISHTEIKCSDISFECSPKIDQRYLAFKTIELVNCHFVSNHKATPQTISHWLGQGISELPQSDPKDPNTCFFKVDDKPTTSKKWKYSEAGLDSKEH